MNKNQTVEYRGCDNLVIAEVLTDALDEEYSAGEVESLAPVAEIGKAVETSTDTKYYDNAPQIVIQAEGADTITLNISVLSLEMLAKITGKEYDEDTGALVDSGESIVKYFACGYRLKLTDGTYRYVWRLKGSFSIPDETSSTETNGTDTNNVTLTYTGIKTITKFKKKNKPGKAIVIDERDGKCNLDKFFDQVQTPDTLKGLKASA